MLSGRLPSRQRASGRSRQGRGSAGAGAGQFGSWRDWTDQRIVTCILLRVWTHGCIFVATQHIASRAPHLQLIDL
ncbi:hypothetical protein XCV2512 [Xanthomonas euvesicatoria pv. vesicatoria str. 85-10]|uniref:Uncharacterized protein n=1 Tax=Xanthomonas euvesicatoria pv. vesicatoria (strain 85-10) TaxID=316273 RepID=Q3BSM0_XANE5|nr:hypothetical protein XCV2512 [Xanthomonas euvesicatoria pv. vesicatoria str. 85-10]